MIIHSYTLDTQDKVKAQYGGTTWVQITNRFLYGSTSAAGTNGGSNDAIVVSHSHTASSDTKGNHSHGITITGGQHNHPYSHYKYGQMYAGTSGTAVTTSWNELGTTESRTGGIDGGNLSLSGTIAENGNHSHNITVNTTGSSGTNANMPAYTTCYIWRRTA